MEATQPAEDYTYDDAQLTNESEVRLEATRYLFFPGNIIPAQRSRERHELGRGGEEIDTPCLRRSERVLKPRFLPRAYITPLELWISPMPKELVPQGARVRPVRGQQEQLGAFGQPIFRSVPLYGVEALPGEHIVQILHVPAEEKKGIVEITKLREVEWETGEPRQVQHLFFPEGEIVDGAVWTLPKTLKALQQRIEAVGTTINDPDIKDIASEMVTSCEQFREWGGRLLDREHTLLKKGSSHQWTYTYSAVGLLLLDQLGVARQDQGMQLLAQTQSRIVDGLNNNGITPEVLMQMQQQNAAMVQAAVTAASEAAAAAMAAALGPFMQQIVAGQQQQQQTAPETKKNK